MGFAPAPSRRQFVGLGCASLLAHAARSAEGTADVRVAAVIGNAAYPTAPLRNPGRDARAMAEILESLGFFVHAARDATKAEMESTVARTTAALGGRRGVGLLYYAGHGLQLDWRNYLVPVDARLNNEDDVRRQALDLQRVLDAFKAAGTRMNIIVLDACRDNPFASSSSARGLAPLDAPPGTFLAYATAPGNVADDGDAQGGNGLYTGYLVRELKRPANRIEDVFKRVRVQVQRHTAGRQVPWESTSLLEDFVFDTRSPGAAPSASSAPSAREAQDTLRADSSAWDRVRNSTDPADFAQFLLDHPNSQFAELAQHRIDRLQVGRVQAQRPREDGATAGQRVAPAGPRYVPGDRFEYRRVRLGFVDRELAPLELEVNWANDTVVVWNNYALESDQLGTVSRVSKKAFPGVESFPETLGGFAELTLGRRWRQVVMQSNGTARLDLEYRVVGHEDVEVPAGRFHAWRVLVSGARDRTPGGRTPMRRTMWIDPSTMTAVKIEFADYGNNRRNEVMELRKVVRGPR
jgi:hypothetical protein